MKPLPGGRFRMCAAVALSTLVFAVSCSSSPSPPNATPLPGHASSSVASGEPSATLPGRLLVTENGKGVRIMKPDGKEVVTVSGTQNELVSQPVWSPDGTKIAWAQTGAPPETVTLAFVTNAAPAQAASGDSSIVTADAGGSGRHSAPTGTGVIYTSWDPTSSRVAFLGNAKAGLELGTVAAGGTRATALDHGSPYYFAWSPDGTQILAHNADGLDDVSLADGKHVPVALPGQFEAPYWGPTSEMFITRPGGACATECLVTQSGGSTTAQTIAPVSSAGADFSPNPGFDAVAIRNRAAAASGSPAGSLQVARREGSRWTTTTLTDQPSLVFYWSPDGTKLLYATLEQAANGPWLHWNVWDGSRTVTFGRFRPGEVFARNYLPFFTQYAQSMRLWAPDGSAFAYAGTDESGRSGIWVQPAGDPASQPNFVSSGDVVTWSPN